MPFVHRHSTGDFWFASDAKIPEVDVADMNEQSPGFTSEEISSRKTAEVLNSAFAPPTPESDVVVDTGNGNGNGNGNGKRK
jgi:hypothetical protein